MMLFNKNKKQQQIEQAKELERQKELEAERLQRETLQREREEAEARAAEALRNTTPYRFSAPEPAPKELISVLKEMLKKLFPDARKAYLV